MEGLLSYRRKANLVLAAVFGLFILAAVAKRQHPDTFWLKMAYAVAEAALVGGIADWFAVTALFRRPLGFPWHTAIVPRNRAKIVAAVAHAVQNELLEREAIKKRLDQVALLELVVGWLEGENRKEGIKAALGRHIRSFLEEADPAELAQAGERILGAAVRRISLARYAGAAIRQAVESGQADRLLDWLLAGLKSAAAGASARAAICRYLERQREAAAAQSWWRKLALSVAEAADALNLEEAGTALHGELLQLLEDLTDYGHPVRQAVRTRLAEAAAALETSPELAASIAEWQQGLGDRVDWKGTLTVVLEAVMADIDKEETARKIERQLEQLWLSLKTDAGLGAWVEQQLKAALGQFIDSEQEFAGLVVRDALGRLSDEDLSRFIEDKAGEDLAWIRINGSVVGGVVGLLLFGLLHFVYEPYVLPLIRVWL